jgi:hypothetical protein
MPPKKKDVNPAFKSPKIALRTRSQLAGVQKTSPERTLAQVLEDNRREKAMRRMDRHEWERTSLNPVNVPGTPENLQRQILTQEDVERERQAEQLHRYQRDLSPGPMYAGEAEGTPVLEFDLNLSTPESAFKRAKSLLAENRRLMQQRDLMNEAQGFLATGNAPPPGASVPYKAMLSANIKRRRELINEINAITLEYPQMDIAPKLGRYLGTEGYSPPSYQSPGGSPPEITKPFTPSKFVPPKDKFVTPEGDIKKVQAPGTFSKITSFIKSTYDKAMSNKIIAALTTYGATKAGQAAYNQYIKGDISHQELIAAAIAATVEGIARGDRTQASSLLEAPAPRQEKYQRYHKMQNNRRRALLRKQLAFASRGKRFEKKRKFGMGKSKRQIRQGKSRRRPRDNATLQFLTGLARIKADRKMSNANKSNLL